MTSSAAHHAAAVYMDTVVSLEVLSPEPEVTMRAAMQRALDWFGAVEAACSRFDERSELRQLLQRAGEPTPASPVLFEAVRFALALADLTDGAFDPTVGQVLERKGFDRHYVTGERVATVLPHAAVSYRDVRLDTRRHTITLRKPLVLDLGAVAKGLAIDLAARELMAFEHFSVDAGGDLYVHGLNADGQPWRVGVQDPRGGGGYAYTLEVSDQGVCTSGDYERRAADGLEHHLVDPRTGHSARGLASVTVVAPTAMAADGLATAAFVLGPEAGLRLLERQGVGGVLVDPAGSVHTTSGLTAGRE